MGRALARLHEIDARFSTYKPDSEISRLDRGDLRLADAHPEVREVLARCEALRRETGGFFDARATGRLDPSALVKGWAVEEAIAVLEGEGVRDVAVYAGGDVAIRGHAKEGAPWRIGIRHPTAPHRVATIVEAGDRLAVATSAAYARGDHIVDPHTGQRAGGLVSLTVAGPDLGTADAYATAGFAMGRQGIDWAATLDRYEAFAILPDGTTLATPGFASV